MIGKPFAMNVTLAKRSRIANTYLEGFIVLICPEPLMPHITNVTH